MVTFWDLLKRYCDDTGATESAVLRKADISHGTFTAWRNRGVPALPRVDVSLALADALKVPYEELVRALLVSAGHLPEVAARALAEELRIDHAAHSHAAREDKTGAPSRGQRRRRGLDSLGEENQDPGDDGIVD